MLAIAQAAALVGLATYPVRVEVQTTRGIPSFEVVGLAEAAVRESRVRVKSALAGVGVDISEHRVTVNLAPADLKKKGSGFDLAIAVATLVCLQRLPEDATAGTLFLGELSLDGTLLPLRGIVAYLVGAKGRGFDRAVVPFANEREAALVEDVRVEVGETFAEVVEALRTRSPLRAPRLAARGGLVVVHDDLADVRGQLTARRALEVAAAGGHNLLMSGPPGAGKTMLARRLPGILPPLGREEELEVLAIHGVAGLLGADRRAGERPFRAPHHTASDVALVGGGEHARPGEVSLAHNGVLFLDEVVEFRRSALEALRQPLEDGVISVCRAELSTTFPARPMVVAAMNPCPCGRRGATPSGGRACDCGPEKYRAYRSRLSGPVMDRLDLHVSLPPVDVTDLQSVGGGESSAVVRARVERARAIQLARRAAGEVSASTNARLSQREVERVCALDAAGSEAMTAAVKRRGLTARAYGRVLRVARTLADLEGRAAIAVGDVAEAISMRLLEGDKAWESAAA